MKRSSAARVAVLLPGALLLAGCGGTAAPPPPSSTSTSTSSPTTSATTSAPSPSTTPSPTTIPNIPAAARAHTGAGAEAFVKHFYVQLNVAWSKPEAGLISALSSPACKSCAALEATASDLLKKGQRYDGLPVTIISVDSIGESDPGQPEVLVRFTQERRSVIDASGKIVLTDQLKQGKFVATLGWSSRGWSVQTVKSIA